MERKHLDAIGNPVVVGNKYGYTIENNGITDIRLGVAQHFTEKGYVTLEIYKSERQYTVDGERKLYEAVAKKSTVKPIKLFPVNEN